MHPRKATRDQLKRHNRLLLLRALYYGLADNRAALAQETGLAKPTVSDLIAELINEGLLEEGGRGESSEGGGKRPTLIRFLPDARQVIGVALDSNRIYGVILNLNGTVMLRHYAEFENLTGEAVIDLMIKVINALVAQLDAPLLCIGVGVAGLVDSETGVVRQSEAVGWHDLSLAERLQSHFDAPVYVGNKSELTAIAQFAFGTGSNDDARNLVTVLVNDGVEVGVAWNRAAYHQGSEISNLPVMHDGKPQRLGDLLGWQAVQHRCGILRRTMGSRWLPGHDLTYLHLRFAANQGDQAAEKLIDELAEHLAQVMVWVVGLFAPNHISLAGPIVNLGEAFLEKVHQKTGQVIAPALLEPVTFSLAYAANLSAIGAAAQAIQKELDVI